MLLNARPSPAPHPPAPGAGPRVDAELAPGRPPVVTARPGGRSPADWVAEHRAGLDALVLRHGCVLVRGLPVRDHAGAAAVSGALIDRPAGDHEPFAPRRALAAALWSSNEWPAEQPMCMHHESSYAPTFPGRLVHCCLEAPDEGGATALADGAAVLRALPAWLRARAEATGWELTRHHNGMVGVDWREAFATDDRGAVERHCAAHGIDWRWSGEDGLTTRRRTAAVLRHPATGVPVWFNQLAFLNEWTMEPGVRSFLVEEFGADGLPYNTRFGDGTPLDRVTVDLINDVYAAHTVREPWRAGDVLVVDNLRMAHSREPYRGPRALTVAFGDPVERLTRGGELCRPSPA
ncbi:TauD/TfdA family dioxygenase [Streptomyces sp. NPDC048182]|uniref:TauD/TfdA family dioxygenase n=1 Tax=Streptomyces sp. NPDC048182 TaxID=3365507 RepID=UPI00371B4364